MYLNPEEQDDAELVIRSLGIKADAEVLGNSFRGGSAVRRITPEAAQALDRHAGIPRISASEADSEPFDPESIIAAHDRTIRSIKARRGQQAFRDALLDAYKGRCAITGCPVIDVLEAAHVTPYLGLETNNITNGLLLRADVHTLLDCGLIGVDPVARTVILAPTLRAASDYKDLHGRRLRDRGGRANSDRSISGNRGIHLTGVERRLGQWNVPVPAATTLSLLESFGLGSRLMQIAWNGCDGLAASSARRVVIREDGGLGTAGSCVPDAVAAHQ
jgi:hypothetical protein